ncbi:DUF503 domain-containing protein [bacterium]|nr:DUF503 domain-containing protein [bacterium]
MRVGVLSVSIHVPEAQSLKERRHPVRSIKDLLRARLNVAVAEVGGSQQWQRTELVVATVSEEEARVRSVLADALSIMERNPEVEILHPVVEVW